MKYIIKNSSLIYEVKHTPSFWDTYAWVDACMQETNALFIHVNYSKIGYSYIIDVRLIDQ